MEMEIDGKLIRLNAQQQSAVEGMIAWFNAKRPEPYILQGFAGTGKTTLLKILLHSLPVPLGKVALIAPTNRAAKVLHNKTSIPTRTVFSLIYSTSREELDWERGRLRMWEESISFAQLGLLLVTNSGDEEELRIDYSEVCSNDGVPETEEGFNKFKEGKLSMALEFEGITLPDDPAERNSLFSKMQGERIAAHRANVSELMRQDLKTVKRKPEELAERYSLILCDEASMVHAEMGNDLVGYGIPTIFVGDPFQLPPVKSKAYWDGKRAHATLTKIERQTGSGAGIPIVGEQIRNGLDIRPNDSVKIRQRNSLTPEEWMGADQIICGTHKTRERLCDFIRRHRGITSEYPIVGEKIVAAYNDRQNGIMNGELYTIQSVKLVRGNTVAKMSLVDPYGSPVPEVFAWTKGFKGRTATDFLDDEYGKFWFGYAITCHQSQGSEWPEVIVCDDWPGKATWDRWMYTAVTRASKVCQIVSSGL